MHRLSFAAVGLALVASAGSPHPNVSIGRDGTVVVQTFQFTPKALEVPAGTRVVWTNGDEIEHMVTAGVPDSAQGEFSGTLASKGTTFSRTFTRPGTYPYYCARHQFMRGVIRVTSTGE